MQEAARQEPRPPFAVCDGILAAYGTGSNRIASALVVMTPSPRARIVTILPAKREGAVEIPLAPIHLLAHVHRAPPLRAGYMKA